MHSRRGILKAAVGVSAGLALPRALIAANATAPLPAGVDDSDLIYVTPLAADGRESRCQAEVWFVRDGDDLVVVTASDAWRARAVQRGLTRTRVWVGDVGVWKSNPRYRDLPSLEMHASLDADPESHTRVLEIFGGKYRLEWIVWGPRFANGLADGSRVMVRYRAA